MPIELLADLHDWTQCRNIARKSSRRKLLLIRWYNSGIGRALEVQMSIEENKLRRLLPVDFVTVSSSLLKSGTQNFQFCPGQRAEC